MQSITRIILIILIFVPFTSHGAVLTTALPLTSQETINSTNISLEITCNDSIVVKKIWQRTANQTAGTVLKFDIGNYSAYATTTTNAEIVLYDFGNGAVCLNGTTTGAMVVVSGDSNYTHYRWTDVNSSTYQGDTIRDGIITFDRGTIFFLQAFIVEYEYLHIEVISSGSGDMATTTIVTANDQVLNFFLLFSIFWMLVLGLIFIIRPFTTKNAGK